MAHKKYGWRIAGFVFKGLCYLIIAAVVGLLAWRIIDRNIVPKPMKTLLANKTVCEAYGQYGEELHMFYQDQNEYTQEEKNYGYFANSGTVFIKEAEQVQFVLRYNNSTLKYTARDYELAVDPSRDEEVFDVSLLIMYDLTPENTEDNDGKTPEAVKLVRIQPSSEPLTYRKTLYNYRKFIFDGVVIDESVLGVYIDIYYVGDVDYEEEPYGTLLLYFYEEENIDYKLTSDDKKALAEFAE